MIRVIATISGGSTTGGNPATVTVNFADTQVGSSGGFGVSVDFTKIISKAELEQILTNAIVAYVNANWSPTMQPGDSVLFT